MSFSSSPLHPPSSNYENCSVHLTVDDVTGAGGAENNQPFTPTDDHYQDAVRNAEVFWSLLQQFHASLGSKIRPVLSILVPKIGGKTLDLHLLFVEVTSRGGFEKVVSDRRWKEVIAAFNLPPTITSASFVIRKYYVSLLYQFEEAYYFGKQVSLPPKSEPAQPSSSPERLQGSSVVGVIDGKFDSGYLVSMKIGGEVLKGVLYHIPQSPQMSETNNASGITPCRTKRSRKSTRDSSRSKKSRKSYYSLSFSEDYVRVQPVCSEQEEKVTNNKGSSRSNLTGFEKKAYEEEKPVNGSAACELGLYPELTVSNLT